MPNGSPRSNQQASDLQEVWNHLLDFFWRGKGSAEDRKDTTVAEE